MILVGRTLDTLAKAQKEIQDKYKVKVQIFICDITKEEPRQKLYDYASNYDVRVVVNNAGKGLSKDFYDATFTEEMTMIDLNIIALQHITKHFYTQFINRKEGRIINISSIAGFVVGSGASTYYATKAYVTSFTRAIAYEAKKENVTVQVVCPGPTRSNFYKDAKTNEKAYRQNPDKLALKAIDSKRVVVLVGFKNKLIHVISKLFPQKWISRFVYKRQEKIRLR